jgi:sortase A
MLRALRALSTALIVAGCALLLDAGITLVWQEPVTAIIAKLHQRQLADELADREQQELTQAQLAALAQLPGERRRIAFLARALRASVKPGDAIGRIKIKRMKLNIVVVEGTDKKSLQKGPGHYESTPFPGMRGTTAFAGHRTTYLAPFRKLNELKRGDNVVLEMPYASLTYKVQRIRIVRPTDTWVLKRKPYDRLILTACHPLYSAAKRIVAFARLFRIVPRGAAARFFNNSPD